MDYAHQGFESLALRRTGGQGHHWRVASRPSPGKPHPRLEWLIDGLAPVAEETVDWPGGMRLQTASYLGVFDLPTELVVSVRCVVTVLGRVLVCEDATLRTDVLPGGRCERGETWPQTARREVFEETGWNVDPAAMSMLGFIHFRHVSPVPDGHPFPHPDFLQVVMHGEGTGTPENWVDVEGWVRRSWLVSFEEADSLPLTAAGSAFLAALPTAMR
jgi:8-oxo-dGTP pyrophosphatase MutT (NUDIX family)